MDSSTNYQEAGSEVVSLRNSFLLPTAKLDDQKFEFYFIMDVSGSMYGRPWELASRALFLFLQSLPADCYFNVITFDEDFTCIFPQSVKYSQETLEQAKSEIPELFTGGYTEDFINVLNYVLSCPQVPGYLTQIFSLTDAELTSEPEETVKLYAANSKRFRSFCLGIGNRVDQDMVKRIAGGNPGMYDYVRTNEFMESKVLNLLKLSLKPALLKPIRVSSHSKLTQVLEP
ncbi:von Willebrand factor A domain-containing protein 5A [Orchesella cincta]|uniref:von Willebrand factor A domain-containing protein 5A n=1 Tax=Orchesella cincta TaxID=48709 RepID=A0A1D2MPI5_ORCCI|nr:von Willebrand factor A domain-containing protein 5A [Orchesella cincta]